MLSAMWRKASKSNGNGGNNCVEVAQLSYLSATKAGDAPKCVAVHHYTPEDFPAPTDFCDCNRAMFGGVQLGWMYENDVLVRDTKENGVSEDTRTVLRYTKKEWDEYLYTLKMGYGAIFNSEEFVMYRDTKFLVFTPAEWDAFMDGVWRGEFDFKPTL